MIDLTKLTEKQLLGLQFASQQARALSDQEYADETFAVVCDSWFAELLRLKTVARTEKIDKLTDVEQKALDVQLQITEAAVRP